MAGKILKHFLFFFVCLIIVAEIGCRIIIDPIYFKKMNLYSQVKEKDTIDYIFIGSSRTAGSIVPEVFAVNDHEISINAGRGYSTGQTHYRALRYLIRRNPDVLKGCAVFLEAPSGMCYTETGEEWIYEDNSQLLIPYLNRNDLHEFLREAKAPVMLKIDVILLYYFASWRDCFFIREKLDTKIKYHLGKLDMIYGEKDPNKSVESDLKALGGIKQDSVSVMAVRKFAYDVVLSDIKNQVLLSQQDLDNSMLARITSLVSNAGGKVYLFDPPLSTVINRIFETDIAVRNKKTFDQWINKKGIPVIKAPFNFTDEDFPDLFHLKASRAEEYTDSLWIAYKAYLNHNQINVSLVNR
jgi:hypothetical protein